ncbi:MAG: hypothetical protein IJ043_10585 [Clostridia bacterium]|nr:hypothetical protein [Clostridia bacterium]
MKRKIMHITAAMMAIIMLLSVFGPMAFAVPVEDPMDAELSGVPSVWFQEHPEWQEVYERSWEIHKKMIKQIGTGCNPEGTYYVDEAFNNNIFMWDTSFMMLFDKYGYYEFPTLESLNNFYYSQHDEEGEEYGFICRVISQSTGADVWPNEVVDGSNKALAAINPPLLSWAEWEQYLIHGDVARFSQMIDGKTVFERLCNFFDYIENSRRKENGLYGGTNGYGNGLDNTPNQDHEQLSWGEEDGAQTQNDLSIQQAQNAYYLALIAAEMGNTEKEAYYLAKYAELSGLINELLWDETTGIYSNLAEDGVTKTNVSTPTSLWAMLAGVATEETAAAMIQNHALNSEKLYRPGGLASLAYDWDGVTTAFVPEGDYWHGSVWAPTSYAYIKGLENYDQYDLAFQEAVRHLNLVTDAYPYEGTLYENYSSEYDIEDTVDGQRRKDFVGWTGCLSIGVIIENIIGVHPDAAENTVDWYPSLTEGYGIENLRFGSNQVALSVAARETAASAVTFAVDAKKAFTLNVHLNGKDYELKVPAGKTTYTVGEEAEGKGGYLGVRVQPLSEVETPLPADALDLVTFTNTLNEKINDGIQYRTDGNGLLYNVNSVGYYWAGSKSHDENPVTLAEDSPLGGYRLVKASVEAGDEGFMAMAPADGTLKTLRLIVGVSGGTAELKAALSDASDAAIDLRLEDGYYAIDLPYRADGSGRSLLAKWVIDNDTAKTNANVSLLAVALLEGGEELPGIPTDVAAESSEGKLKVTASPAFGETYDAYAVYYGTERAVVETLPALLEVELYENYEVAVAGIRNGVEGEKAVAASAFIEPAGINDYARALEDLEQTLPAILGLNSETETVANYQMVTTGAVYGSTITFETENNDAAYGVADNGAVTFPPYGHAPVQSKITLTATRGGVTARRVLYTNVQPLETLGNRVVNRGATHTTTLSTVDLTAIGGLDWVQLTDGTNFSLANMAQKKDAEIITKIYWGNNGRQQTVTDHYYNFTATDGTAATVDRFALSTRNAGSSINVELASGSEARRVRVYAGGWKSDYRVELLINGQVASFEDCSTGTVNKSSETIFDYRAKETDEVQLRLTLVDPTAHGATNGSAYLAAVAVEKLDYTAENAASVQAPTTFLEVDLTAEGSLDWVQLTGSTYKLADMVQKKDASVIADLYWENGGRQQTVKDTYFTFSATDGTGEPVDRYANSTRNVNTAITAKLTGSNAPRVVKVYAGSWKADYRVELWIGGVVQAVQYGIGSTSQISVVHTFAYQAAETDEILIKLVLADPTAYGATNGSAILSAIAVSDHAYGDWEVVTEPTPEAEGLRKRTCADCAQAEEQTLPKLLGTRTTELQAVIDRISNMDTKWFEEEQVAALQAQAEELQAGMAEMSDAALYAAEKQLLIAATTLSYETYPSVAAKGTLPAEPAYYLISTLEEYNYWVSAVNDGSWGSGNVALGASLDLSSVATSVNGFTGSFDGQGHTLSGLKAAMFSSFAGTLKDLTCTGFARTGTATKQAALIDATCGDAVLQNITMKDCTLSNGYGISGLLVGQPGGSLSFYDITLEHCSASFINSFGGKGLLLGGGADGSTWYGITMDRILLKSCTLTSAAQTQSYQRTGMLAGEVTSNGSTAIRNVLMIDCNGSAPISEDNSVYYDASLIACRLGSGDTISGCLILGGSFEGMENVSSANVNNHGTVSRCYWNGETAVPDLKQATAEMLADGSLAYLLSQISGQWTVKNGETVLKAPEEQPSYQVTFSWGEDTALCYTDFSGKLITLPETSAVVWMLEESPETAVFTENTEIIGLLRGDVNGSGAVETADAILVLQYLVGNSMDLNQAVADCNQDGRVSIFDAVTLLQGLSE